MPGEKVPHFDPPRKPADFPPRPFVDDRGLEWRDVVGYEGLYLISETGDVFSLSSNRSIAPTLRSRRSAKVTLYAQGAVFNTTVHHLCESAFGNAPQWCIGPGRLSGAANHHATVADDVVRWAREEVVSGRSTCKAVAEHLGLSQPSVNSWVLGRTRRAAGGPVVSPGSLSKGIHSHRQKISDSDVASARSRVANGELCHDVAASLGVCHQLVWKWAVGEERAEAGGPIRGIDYTPAKPQPEPTPEPEEFEAKRKLMYDEHGELAFIQIDFDAEDDE